LDTFKDSLISAKDSIKIYHAYIVKKLAVKGATLRVKDLFSNLKGIIYLKKK
jgi:hypothetical protein